MNLYSQMPIIRRLMYLLTLTVTLSGCVVYSASSMPGATLPHPTTTPPPPERPMPASTLVDLITAEKYIDAGRPDLALPYYIQQSKTTDDPAVLERAARLALLIDHPQSALDLSRQWHALQPQNLAAESSLASSLWHLGHYDETVPYLADILKKDPHASFEDLLLSRLPASPAELQQLQSALDHLVQALPASVEAHYVRAFWEAHQKNYEVALKDCQQARELENDFLPASLLQVQIYEMTQRDTNALDLLHHLLHRYPDADLLRQNEAALLIRMSRNAEAEADYIFLAQRHPFDGDLWLAHALLALQDQHLSAAAASLNMLLKLQQHENDAHYYLGQIDLVNHKDVDALDQFDAVTSGPDYLPALQASASLREKMNQTPQALALIKHALVLHPDYYTPLTLIESDVLMTTHQDAQAAALLEDGLHRFPDNTDLLYARAMLAVDQNDLQKFETDIRKVLAKDPHNAVALNALGYTLADRTTRYQEAYAYIQEALKLTPKDPAIIDSMGWVEYRLGHREQAETLLRQAWNIIHDDEIGSHYGEVLWVLGQKDEANKVWQESLKTNPLSPYIPATRKRLGAS